MDWAIVFDRVSAAIRLHSDTFQQKKTALEAECRELLETRYQRATEAVKYELLVKRNDSRLRDVSQVRGKRCCFAGRRPTIYLSV